MLNSGLADNEKTESINNMDLNDINILISIAPAMHPNVDTESIVLSNQMHEDFIVFDAVYNTNETGLLK